MRQAGGSAARLRAGDARACADRVARLLREPALYDRLRRRARQDVEINRPLARTIDHIEASLQRYASPRAAAAAAPASVNP